MISNGLMCAVIHGDIIAIAAGTFKFEISDGYVFPTDRLIFFFWGRRTHSYIGQIVQKSVFHKFGRLSKNPSPFFRSLTGDGRLAANRWATAAGIKVFRSAAGVI